MTTLRLSDFFLTRIGFEHTKHASARHVLRCGITTVGRGINVDLQARTEFAGRNHCVIRVEGNRVLVKDNKVRIGCEY